MFLSVALVFAIWLIITLMYIVKPSALGFWRAPLHRYGWVNRWDMFVPTFRRAKAKYDVQFRDKDAANELGNWQELVVQRWHPLIFVTNVQGRLDKLYLMTVRALLRHKEQGKPELQTHPMFQYLCAVICQLPASETAVSRQIKIEYIHPNSEVEEIVSSEFIALK